MTTLAEHMIVVGVENRPPMLDKSMYNSWQSRMLLYLKGKKNGRMMLESIKNGPLIYPTTEEDGKIYEKKYAELAEQEKLQDDCDVQATNIVLQDLPPDVYSLVNHCQAAKDIWTESSYLCKALNCHIKNVNVNCTMSLTSLLQSRRLLRLLVLIRKRHNKTPYELLHNKKPDLSYLYVFVALCYPTNDSEDLGKLKPKADIGIFVGLVQNHSSPTPFIPPTKNGWEILFQTMFDEHSNPPPSVDSPVPAVVAPEPADSTSTPSLTPIDQDTSSLNNDRFFRVPIPEVNSEESS
ncbi:hypothetical protein Tco_0832351 [Tanacetum coccineum]